MPWRSWHANGDLKYTILQGKKLLFFWIQFTQSIIQVSLLFLYYYYQNEYIKDAIHQHTFLGPIIENNFRINYGLFEQKISIFGFFKLVYFVSANKVLLKNTTGREMARWSMACLVCNMRTISQVPRIWINAKQAQVSLDSALWRRKKDSHKQVVL